MSDDNLNRKRELPVEIKNADGDSIQIQQEGTVLQVTAHDPEARQLLQGILGELKKMNFYLSQMSDIELDLSDFTD